MAEYHLYFDGSCQPNPGRGAWGAALYHVPPGGVGSPPPAPPTEVWAAAGTLGTAATSNTAEFGAAIAGLRGVVAHLAAAGVDAQTARVRVWGDSAVVVGALARTAAVRAPRLGLYAAVARGILGRLPGAVVEAVPREANGRAHRLAADVAAAAAATRRSAAPGERVAACQPVLAAEAFLDGGTTVAASTDLGADEPGDAHCLIDAAFLAGLPRKSPGGHSALAAAEPPAPDGPTLVRVGRGVYPILGVVEIGASITIPAASWGDEPPLMTDVDPLVLHIVDGLPVPLHLASAAPGMDDLCEDLEVDYDALGAAEELTGRYIQHSFWR